MRKNTLRFIAFLTLVAGCQTTPPGQMREQRPNTVGLVSDLAFPSGILAAHRWNSAMEMGAFTHASTDAHEEFVTYAPGDVKNSQSKYAAIYGRVYPFKTSSFFIASGVAAEQTHMNYYVRGPGFAANAGGVQAREETYAAVFGQIQVGWAFISDNKALKGMSWELAMTPEFLIKQYSDDSDSGQALASGEPLIDAKRRYLADYPLRRWAPRFSLGYSF